MEHKSDRLSELPEPVVEHILSFIPLKKILQLSTLSKRWQNVWALLPIPKLNSKFYASKLYEISGNKEKEKIKIESEEFNYFVERTLVSRCKQKLRINKFNLKISVMDEPDYVVANRWIGYAIESNVKELNLGLKSFLDRSQVKPDEYQVPENILRAKSIILLNLCGGNLKSKSSYSNINLSSLRKLVLSHVDMDDQIFSSLIYGCPVLEEILIGQCYGLKNIQLSACLPKLMSFKLRHFSEQLESFEMEAPNLKKLVLNSPIVTDKWLSGILSKHPLIESLELHLYCRLERIKISSDRMKSLTIHQGRLLVGVNIVTPNLHTLDYIGDVISLSSNAFTLSEVDLFFWSNAPLDVEKIEFLAKLSHPKLLTWSGCAKSLIAPKELREILPSPLYNVKQLKLNMLYPWHPRVEIIELVDSLLWIFPLLEILIIKWDASDNISFKFSYETSVYKSKNPSCCKFLPVPCWRHCLKIIKIDDSGRFADVQALKKYFHKNAEILESIL